MKNIKTLIKNNIVFFFIEFNLLLSVIGIFAGMSAAKNNQYDNPFLLLLPISNFLWVFFALFGPRPQKKVEIDEEIEASIKFYGLPPRRKLTHIQLILIKLAIKIILAISVLIVLVNFSLMLLMTLTTVVVPAFFPP